MVRKIILNVFYVSLEIYTSFSVNVMDGIEQNEQNKSFFLIRSTLMLVV